MVLKTKGYSIMDILDILIAEELGIIEKDNKGKDKYYELFR